MRVACGRPRVKTLGKSEETTPLKARFWAIRLRCRPGSRSGPDLLGTHTSASSPTSQPEWVTAKALKGQVWRNEPDLQSAQRRQRGSRLLISLPSPSGGRNRRAPRMGPWRRASARRPAAAAMRRAALGKQRWTVGYICTAADLAQDSAKEASNTPSSVHRAHPHFA